MRSRQSAEPRLDRSKRTHEAARLQELAPPAAAGREIAVEALLIDRVHMEEPIGGTLVVYGVLDILAYYTRALLIAAAEEIGAAAMVMLVVLVRVL